MNDINEFEAILLVDDDPVINILNSKFLRRAGYLHKIWKFEDGLEAYKYLQHIIETQKNIVNKNPVLILLDLNMPDFSGWDFIEKYKHLDVTLKKNFRIVVLSSSTSKADIDKINENENVFGYIIKPFSIASIDAIEKFFKYS
ncbi:response regulator [Belliella sp. DSM 107340]|uniref:Response regulator n=1 Tax=Belliella calami TaxID=2923436 RepID=A0ABS9UKG5_9BACT|nr:response regulator [Belliella calami]MCH7396670.1 response regulator [Belliella calami]